MFRENKHKVNFCANENNKFKDIAEWQKAMNGEVKPDCGHYTKTQNLLAENVGIKTRVLGIADIPDTSLGAHTFNEVWWQGKWRYTDMTHNIWYITDSTGNVYSAYELYLAAVANATSHLIYVPIDTNVAFGPKLKEVMLVSLKPPSILRYYHINNWSSYESNSWTRFKNRYFFRPAFYTPKKYDVWRYALKHIAMLIGIVALLGAVKISKLKLRK
jgi:hypothetical protein